MPVKKPDEVSCNFDSVHIIICFSSLKPKGMISKLTLHAECCMCALDSFQIRLYRSSYQITQLVHLLKTCACSSSKREREKGSLWSDLATKTKAPTNHNEENLQTAIRSNT